MRRVGLGLFFGLALVACVSLKMADTSTPGDPDASTADGKDASSSPTGTHDGNVEPADAGTPPIDFECGRSNPWTSTQKTDSGCAPRIVTLVDDESAIDTRGIAIARTSKGRVGIVYYRAEFADAGDMRLAHFLAAKPPFSPVILTRSADFTRVGAAASIVATGDDTLQILTHDVMADSGDVSIVRLVDGASVFSAPETVMTAVADGTLLGFAADRLTGALYATALLKQAVDGGSIGRIIARSQTPGNPWVTMQDLASGLDLRAYAEIGATSLVVDLGGQLHVVYHAAAEPGVTTPRYQAFDGTLWTPRKTLDNAAADGYSGFSPRLAVFGTVKHAAFFYERAGQSDPRHADLRLASWQGTNDLPTLEILTQSLAAPATPLPSGTSPPYRVAMDVDKYGLVHLALVDVSTGGDAQLSYIRQSRDASGSVKWLKDVIDPDVLPGFDAFVDLLVDENARPHIAYRSGANGKVYYATRTDR